MMKIPFYRNPDQTHCYQTSLKMIIESFFPERIYGYDKLDKITDRRQGLWSWPLAGINWMSTNGFDVRVIERFDFEAFVRKPTTYLYQLYGPEVAKAQIDHLDIAKEVKHAQAFCKIGNFLNRIPTLNDLQEFLRDGFLIIVNLNSKALSGCKGYEGHSVVVRGFDDAFLYLNDSGRDDGEKLKVSHSFFSSAWYYPNENAGNCYAFKKFEAKRNLNNSK